MPPVLESAVLSVHAPTTSSLGKAVLSEARHRRVAARACLMPA